MSHMQVVPTDKTVGRGAATTCFIEIKKLLQTAWAGHIQLDVWAAPYLPPLACDLAFMTGNVAQVFLTDEAWHATLRGIHTALVPGGRLIFETRDPAREAWRDWHREATYQRIEIPDVGAVEDWGELTDVDLPFVTFDSFVRFERGGDVIASTSTLRFRTHDEVAASLAATSFVVDEVRDAPDRPGREFVFVARRA